MPKVRVYELAKELNMESKDLVERLLASGMNVKNYMSTLDEESAAQARDIATGKVSEVIEEKRIKSTVIRRRKKRVRVEPEADSAAAPQAEQVESSEAEGAEEARPAEHPAMQGPAEDLEGAEVEDARAEVAETAKPSEGGRPEEAGERRTGEPAVKKPKKPKRKKGEKAAKIIKRPEEGPLREVVNRQAEKEKKGPEQRTEFPGPTEMRGEAAPAPQREKPSKKKKRGKTEVAGEALPKQGFRHRKKEVYEKADLYEGRKGRPRPKKPARRTKETAKRGKQTEITVPKASKRRIKIHETVTVAELAKAMGAKASELIKRLMGLGIVANINQSLDFETAALVADELGYELELETFEEERLLEEEEDRPEDLEPRPPVVTIMGHVDHGKTSLLDYIRNSNIIGGEKGGITQHIGAYFVKADGGDIVFLDTPGHEAFTAMRARGAEVTDLIVLVVAADDGVMPQTKEAINHARAADIPIVVAVNKMDKAQADPEKVKRGLAEVDLSPEEWGGDTIFGYISAKTGEGVDDLMGLVLLQSEILELKANPNRTARGVIIEAKLDKSKGAVATVLIKNGTLEQGDHFICGEYYGRVRAMLDHRGRKISKAGPSWPVEIYGISGVPMAGDEFLVVQDDKTAKQVIDHRKSRTRKYGPEKKGLVSLDDLYERIKEGEVKELNIVLKADVQGSLEALTDSLAKLSTEEVKVDIIHSGTGAIAESDVMLASASGAIVIGFNVRANQRVIDIAERENVDIRYYNVIYDAVQDIRLAMAGLLEPVYKENVIGHANVKEVFRVPKVGAVAGCQVTDGRVERNSNARLLRDDVVVFDGKISSLKRYKEDAREVQSGYECGIGVENFQDFKPGDVFEVYKVEEVQAEI